MTTVPEWLAALWRRAPVRLVVYLSLFGLTVWFAGQLLSVIVTALLAYALAFLVQPVLLWLEGRGVRRPLGVGLVVLVVLAVALVLSWVFLAQVIDFVRGLPLLLGHLGTLAATVLDRLSRVSGLEDIEVQLGGFVNTELRELGRNLPLLVSRLLSTGGTLLGGVVSLVGWVGQAAFVLVLSVYFMLIYRGVGASVLRMLPRTWQPAALSLSEDLGVAFGGYLRGQLLVGAAVGVLVALGLTVLGIPNALAIGLLAGVLDLVPYLGPVVAAVPAVLLALPGGWVPVALVVLVFVLANQIEGHFLSPYVLGHATHLSSAGVLLALLAGLTLGGLPGMILAVPVVTLLKRWLEKYWLTSTVHEVPPPAGSIP